MTTATMNNETESNVIPEQQAIGAQQLANVVDQYFTCFDITYTWQRAAGQRQIRGARVQLGDKTLTKEQATRPTSRLMPKKWRDRFQAIETSKSQLIRLHTLPGMARGTACVRSNKVHDLVQQLCVLRQRVHDARDMLIDAWDTEIIQWNADRWDADWPRIQKHLPSKDALPFLIDLTWSQFRVSPQFDDVTETGGSPVIDEMLTMTREMTASRVTEFVNTIFTEPRERLKSAVEKVLENIRAGQRITNTTFNQMRDAARFLREITGIPGLHDADLLARLEAVEARIEASPRRFGSDGRPLESLDIEGNAAAGQQLVNALDAVIERADNTAVARGQVIRFGRLGRGLEL